MRVSNVLKVAHKYLCTGMTSELTFYAGTHYFGINYILCPSN